MECKFDIFAIGESSLSDKVDNEKLRLDGFSSLPLRSDCKNIEKRAKGGVLLYYKNHLPLKHRHDLELIDEAIVVEVKLKKENIFIVALYRSPNQSSEELKNFNIKIARLLKNMSDEKPSNIIFTGDFNARSPLLWDEELEENPAGKIMSDFALSNCLEQVINEPTHFFHIGRPTCIDLILTSQKDAIVDSGVVPSPDPFCKHQIIFGKLNYSLPCPPPHKRTLWEYKCADIDNIREAMRILNWVNIFGDRNHNEMVSVFTKTFLGIMKRHIPSKIVTVNSRDAPWVTPVVKTALRRNHRTYKTWLKNGEKT